jgi:S-adenosylmethionine hydrolase
MLSLHFPYRTPDGTLVGQVLHIDSFGNLTTNIRSRDLPESVEMVTIEMGNRTISGLSPTYAESKGLLALIGSSGYLEIALAGDSARAVTGAEVGSELRVRW